VSTEFRFQLRRDQGEEFGIMREEGLVNIRSGENQDVVARTELYGALEAITSKRCLSRQRSRVRVSSSPPF